VFPSPSPDGAPAGLRVAACKGDQRGRRGRRAARKVSPCAYPRSAENGNKNFDEPLIVATANILPGGRLSGSDVCELSIEELKEELGLSNLQAGKVRRLCRRRELAEP
jgi:hypothetical protein